MERRPFDDDAGLEKNLVDGRHAPAQNADRQQRIGQPGPEDLRRAVVSGWNG